jgi:predicted Rossmann-fold nucleotide-binding protein
MKYKIGVFGSAAGELDKVIPKAKELGRELAAYNQKVIVVTGGCSGLPYPQKLLSKVMAQLKKYKK